MRSRPAGGSRGLRVTAVVVAVAERLHARRCARRPAIARSLGTLAVTALLAWVATRYLAAPAIDILNGSDPAPTQGDTLP